MRISELCALKVNDVNLYDKNVLIYGKSAKERRIQIGNDDVVRALQKYKDTFEENIQKCGHFSPIKQGALCQTSPSAG